jgi:hypothetical protein
MLSVGPVKPTESIPRAIWLAMSPEMRLVLVSNQQVVMDDEGLPILHDDVLAVTIRDISIALAIEKAPAPANAT